MWSLTIANFTNSTGTDITLQKSVKLMRAITFCSTITPDYRYDKIVIDSIGNVYCPNKVCSDTLCVHKKTFHSLEWSDCQCPQCKSTCQMCINPLELPIVPSVLKFQQRIFFFKETQKSFQDVIGDGYCSTCTNQKCAYLSTNKKSSFYGCKKFNACSNLLNFPFADWKPTFSFFGRDRTHYFARKTSSDWEREKPSSFL